MSSLSLTSLRGRRWIGAGQALALALAACSGGHAPPASASGIPIPESRAGTELLGEDVRAVLPVPLPARGVRGAPAGSPRATLVRFWTGSCPHCASSLPAIEALRREYRARGLATLAVFHPKPPGGPGDLDEQRVRDEARRLGYAGALAVDPDWSSLERLRPGARNGEPTSISLLLDAAGRVRWVHPGPDLFPSRRARDSAANADYEDLVTAIEVLLAEGGE